MWRDYLSHQNNDGSVLRILATNSIAINDFWSATFSNLPGTLKIFSNTASMMHHDSVTVREAAISAV